MATVRDFKNLVAQKTGNQSAFVIRSEAHFTFWTKLNDIGARNMGTKPPETVPDIDATVELSESEWAELEAEFQSLL